MIDLERFNRYQEKRSLISQRLDFIVEWSQEDIDLKKRFAIYKVGQEAIEGVIDIVAMINRLLSFPFWC